MAASLSPSPSLPLSAASQHVGRCTLTFTATWMLGKVAITTAVSH